MSSQITSTALEEAAAIVEEFQFFDDWEDRYQLLIDHGRKLAPFPADLRDETHRLRGCQSTVFFAAKHDSSGTITFLAESDAAIVQGLVALLIRVYSGRSASEIHDTEPTFLTDIGLNSHLSATRKNGLASMIGAIKAAARETLS